MSKREAIYFRYRQGMLEPADSYARSRLAAREYKDGDVLKADLRKPRSAKFNRLVHRIGQLVAANIEGFEGLDSHVCVKRLQLEGRIACEEIGIMIPGYGMVVQYIPRSLSFEAMDESEYREAARNICRWIAKIYWGGMTAEQIEQMAENFVDE